MRLCKRMQKSVYFSTADSLLKLKMDRSRIQFFKGCLKDWMYEMGYDVQLRHILRKSFVVFAREKKRKYIFHPRLEIYG